MIKLPKLLFVEDPYTPTVMSYITQRKIKGKCDAYKLGAD